MTSDDADAAFIDFMGAHSAGLLRTAHLLVGDPFRAEDLLQTALTKTYANWSRIRDVSAARAYTRKVLANTATSWWRMKMTHERPVDEMPEVGVPDATGQRDDALMIAEYVRQLPRRQRAVLVLRFYEDMSEAEVAETLGISKGTAKSTASRALARLRELMKGDPKAEVFQ